MGASDVAPRKGKLWKPLRYRRKVQGLKRTAVLSVAAEAFCERGFHSTSLDEIAERLHVTKPTLYYYFKSKNEILYECVRMGLVNLESAVDELSALGGTGYEILRRVMHKYAELALNVFSRCATQVGQDPLPESSRRKLRKMEKDVAVKIRAVIQRGVTDGSLAPCDPRIVASNFAGSLSWIARWYQPDGPMSATEIALLSIDSLLNGMLPRRATRVKSARVKPQATHRATISPARRPSQKAGRAGSPVSPAASKARS